MRNNQEILTYCSFADMVVADGETSVPKYENVYEFECMYESYVLKTNPFRFLLHNLNNIEMLFCMQFRSVICFCFHVLKFQDYTDFILLHFFFTFMTFIIFDFILTFYNLRFSQSWLVLNLNGICHTLIVIYNKSLRNESLNRNVISPTKWHKCWNKTWKITSLLCANYADANQSKPQITWLFNFFTWQLLDIFLKQWENKQPSRQI